MMVIILCKFWYVRSDFGYYAFVDDGDDDGVGSDHGSGCHY